jgi:hypothetical protein
VVADPRPRSTNGEATSRRRARGGRDRRREAFETCASRLLWGTGGPPQPGRPTAPGFPDRRKGLERADGPTREASGRARRLSRSTERSGNGRPRRLPATRSRPGARRRRRRPETEYRRPDRRVEVRTRVPTDDLRRLAAAEGLERASRRQNCPLRTPGPAPGMRQSPEILGRHRRKWDECLNLPSIGPVAGAVMGSVNPGGFRQIAVARTSAPGYPNPGRVHRTRSHFPAIAAPAGAAGPSGFGGRYCPWR